MESASSTHPKQSKEHIEKKVQAYKEAVERRRQQQVQSMRIQTELEQENKTLRKDLSFVVNHLQHLQYEVQSARQSLSTELERTERLNGFIASLIDYTRQTDVFEYKDDVVVDAVETDDENEPISRHKKKRSNVNH